MTDNLDVIDQFLAVFIRYIDSGFGLVSGDVHSLTSILLGIDVAIAAMFWAVASNDDIIIRLVRKILYVGSFAFIINNFSRLADAIFKSFVALGLKAGGGSLTTDTLMQPGKLAGAGFDAAWPMLDQASKLMGFASFFDNFLTIVVLMIAWFVVIFAFFVLAVQLFVTILEFKLTGLAGFTLVPFALWNRTSFLAERVLGSVVTSGIKVMVLAVIVSIGSGFFTTFAAQLHGQDVDIGQAMSMVLASLSLFGLGIFGPSIASGLVSGGPQLGAAAAAGSAAVAAGAIAATGTAALAGVRSAVRLADTPRQMLVHPSATPPTTNLGQPAGPSGTPGNTGGGVSTAKSAQSQGAPDWAVRLGAEQKGRARRQNAIQLLREGERGGAGASPNIGEQEGQ